MVVGSPTKLNLIPSGVMPVVYINQGDAGYDKEFLIYNGDSPYNVPAGVSATIRGKKADGYGVTEAAALTEGSNLVTVTITEQMVAAAGANLYELVFVDTDGLRIATINMVWAVKKDALGDAVISDSDLNYVNEALDKIQNAEALKNQLDTNTADIAEETAARITADNVLQNNINAEATARAAADTTLQNNINTEAYTRAEQDAVLSARMDTFSSLPSGSTSGDAELLDIRVGANGTTYPSAGDAVRGQVTNLNSDLDYTSDVLKTVRKRLGVAYIAANGVITSGGAFETICFQVLPGSVIGITCSATNMVYAFFTDEPEIGSTSYNNARVIVDSGTATNVNVPSTCTWIAVRINKNGDARISPESYIISNINTRIDNAKEISFKVPTGIGTDAIDLPDNTDLNNITSNGIFYLAGNTYGHSPFANGQYAFLLSYSSSAIKMQICIGYNTRTKFYIRDYGGSSWHSWKEYDVASIINKALIPETTDLTETDLNKVFGNHIWLMTDTYTYTNKPTGFTSNAGFLQVAEVSGGFALQVLYQFTGGKVWKRRGKNASTPVWEDWHEIDGAGGTTNQYTFNEYSQSVTLTASPSITADTNNYLAPSGDTSDRTADILSMLSSNGICRLGAGDYYVNGLQMPDGSSLIGSGYTTRLILSGTADGFAIRMGSHCLVEDMRIVGASSAPTHTSTAGGRHGILWQGTYTADNTAPFRSIVNNLHIENFSGGGITCYDTGYGTSNALEATNIYVRGCWAGINISYWSEFHKFTNVRCGQCRIGCVNNGGNNVFVNCDFSSCEEIAFLMDNSNDQSPNNAHGSCVGCVFNHTQSGGVANSGIGVKILNCANGFVFTGCQIFFSQVDIEDSDGVVVSDSNFGSTNCDITVKNGGAVVFANNMHQTAPTITVTNNDKVHFVNCYVRDTGAAVAA